MTNRIRVLYAVHIQNRNQKCKKAEVEAEVEDNDTRAEVSAVVLQLYHRPIIPIKTMLIFQGLGLRTQQAR